VMDNAIPVEEVSKSICEQENSDAPLTMSTSSRENSIISGASCILANVARMYLM
jgi:hypothetical protein